MGADNNAVIEQEHKTPQSSMPERVSFTDALIKTSSVESGHETATGLDRFLNSLDTPTQDESRKLKEYIDKLIADSKKGYDENRERPNMVLSGRTKDPLIKDIVRKEHNAVIRGVLPQVVSNIAKMLELDLGMDIKFSQGEFTMTDVEREERENYLSKRKDDLLTLLKFEPWTKGENFGEREIRLSLSLIDYMIDANMGRSAYSQGLKKLFWGLKEDPDYTIIDELQKNGAQEELEENARQLYLAIGTNYGIDSDHLPRKVSLDWYAERVDPDYYMMREERLANIHPNRPLDNSRV